MEGALTVAVQRWLDERVAVHVTDRREEERVISSQRLLDLLRAPRTETVTDVADVIVEVVKEVEEYLLHAAVRWKESSDLITRRVLHSTAHLQQLQLTIDMPSIDASFGLVPHLRHLHVEQRDSKATNNDVSLLDILATLDTLPQLTSLRCVALRLSIADLLLIAAHSTLDTVVIECDNNVASLDEHWLGYDFLFPS